MGDLAAQLATAGPVAPIPTGRRGYPDGWQPRSEIDFTHGGYIVTTPATTDQPPDAQRVLRDEGLDPADWVLTGFRRSRWQHHPGGPWLYAFRVQVVPRRLHQAMVTDRADLIRHLARWKPRRRAPAPATRNATFTHPVGDLQIGKVDGDGTEGTARRFLDGLQHALDRHAAYRARPGTVLLPWLGDCIEGVWSQNGALRMRLDQPPAAQVRIVRRLMAQQVKAFLEQADQVVVPVVPGNHDETVRTAGAMSTRYDDSWAVEAASAVMDGLAENPHLDNRIHFLFPHVDGLTVVGDWSGVRVGMTHGHQFGRDPLRWWDEQAGGRTPVGDADVLLAGHLHHLRLQDHGGARLFLQIPALDGGSVWYGHRHGQFSPGRTVTFLLDDGHIRDLDPVL